MTDNKLPSGEDVRDAQIRALQRELQTRDFIIDNLKRKISLKDDRMKRAFRGINEARQALRGYED